MVDPLMDPSKPILSAGTLKLLRAHQKREREQARADIFDKKKIQERQRKGREKRLARTTFNQGEGGI